MKDYKIVQMRSCWGDLCWFGFIGDYQHTEDYSSVEELIEHNPEYAGAKIYN